MANTNYQIGSSRVYNATGYYGIKNVYTTTSKLTVYELYTDRAKGQTEYLAAPGYDIVNYQSNPLDNPYPSDYEFYLGWDIWNNGYHLYLGSDSKEYILLPGDSRRTTFYVCGVGGNDTAFTPLKSSDIISIKYNALGVTQINTWLTDTSQPRELRDSQLWRVMRS
jgi:hypothetical protein